MARSRHTQKEIEAAFQYALDRGWILLEARGHAWGKLRCPHHERDGCTVHVHSTP